MTYVYIALGSYAVVVAVLVLLVLVVNVIKRRQLKRQNGGLAPKR